MAPPLRLPGRSPRAAALVIVLAFIVLLTGLIVAFFSLAMSDRQVSNGSANSGKTELFAKGAIDQIVSNLKQEIVAGSVATSSSNSTAITVSGTTYSLYIPTAPQSAVPCLSGSITTASPSGTVTSLPANLLKVSAYQQPFYSGAAYSVPLTSASAAQVSTSGTSLNGRYISPARWNAPLLLPKLTPANTTNFTPITTGTAAFPIPDWILVTRGGSKPTAFSPALITSASNSTSVIGRYAYAIYNEGGLLDANVAGGPATTDLANVTYSGSSAAQTVWARKGSAAFADLTQLPGLAAIASTSGTARAQQIVDNLVGWRNYASARLSGTFPALSFTATSTTNYLTNILGLNTAGMTTANLPQWPANNQTDRAFSSRQQLLAQLQAIAQNSTELADLQGDLQYLGTFSRSLNQPSYAPPSGRPTVVGPAYTSGAYSGGNDGYQNDNNFNPIFRSIRVTGTFQRNDGSIANVGEPLVKKRFALSRLCWITPEGPSASLSTGDPIYQAYINAGVSPQLLAEGGTANIQNYFGLTWTSGTGSKGLGGYWTYNHGVYDGSGDTTVGWLSEIQTKTTPLLPREADFFELLQAAINVGSLSKAFGGNNDGYINVPAATGTNFYTEIKDNYTVFHILQLGANIIDCANPTQYPTCIKFLYAPPNTRSVYGAMDLPYLYGYRDMAFITQIATPAPTAEPNPPSATPPTNPGSVAALMVPVVWNPYDVNSPAAGDGPSYLRVTAIDAPLVPQSASTTTDAWQSTPHYSATGTGAFTTYGTKQSSDFWPNENSTALTFSNNTVLYRDPTVLFRVNSPSGSNLALGTGNSLSTGTIPFASSAGIAEVPLAVPGVDSFIGFYMGSYPQCWKSANVSGTYCTTNWIEIDHPPSSGVTFRMEYSVSGLGGPWVPYKEYYVPIDTGSLFVPTIEQGNSNYPSVLLPNTLNNSSLWDGLVDASKSGYGYYRVAWDPRTLRWGMPGYMYGNGGNFTPQPNSGGGDVMRFLDASGVGGRTRTDVVQSLRFTPAIGTAPNFGATYDGGWFPASIGFSMRLGGVSQNLNNTMQLHYADADGVIRPAMGAYDSQLSTTGSASSSVGLPMASTVSYQGNPNYTPAASSSGTNIQSQSRSLILHRPYRTVAELGYVFTDTPWKDIDFFTPCSGDSPLLDTFCINEDSRSDGLIAGKVDLNTRQTPVLQALLAGAYRDEAGTAATNLSVVESSTIAAALVARTTNSTVPGEGPLTNIADLVGRWTGSTSTVAQVNNFTFPVYDGTASYSGFSADLTNLYSTSGASNNVVQRFRQTAMRALSDAGMAGTWNLMIDVIAQVGRYPAAAQTLNNFLVEGERRYWVHVAIDRQSGTVIDEQIERVDE